MKKQEFLVDTIGTFQTYIYQDNRKIIPTSATITVYEPNSESVLINAQAMTVGGDGLLSYALTATHNDTADENYHTEISYVFDSVTEYVTMFYNIVTSILYSTITDNDVVMELPQITEKGYREYGVSASGSTTTMVNLELQRYPDDYWTGGVAVSLTQDEKREITDFVSSTGTVTTTAFPATTATDKYMLIRSYSREINRALDKIKDRIQRKGYYYALILDSADLKELHIILTVSEICKGFIVSTEDVWHGFHKDYEKKFEDMFRTFKFKYDLDEDGFLGSGEEGKDYTIVRSGRG